MATSSSSAHHHRTPSDSGWVSICPDVGSVFVTIGDIAQVWSNGKLKKVRGRAVPAKTTTVDDGSQCISMTLLMTLPLDATVSPLLPIAGKDGENLDDDDDNNDDEEERIMFNSFSFEDYAWRIYHVRVHHKDYQIPYLVC